MALRLVRWLKSAPSDGPRSFAEAACGYLDQGSFVTGPVRCCGRATAVRAVGGHARLLGGCERREVQNRHFGRVAPRQQAAGSTAEDPIPVEGFSTRSSPAGAQAPVLLVPGLDG